MFKGKRQSIPQNIHCPDLIFTINLKILLIFPSMSASYIFIVFMVLYFWKYVVKFKVVVKFINFFPLYFVPFVIWCPKNIPLCVLLKIEKFSILFSGLYYYKTWFLYLQRSLHSVGTSDFWFCKSSGEDSGHVGWSLTPGSEFVPLSGLLLLVGWRNASNFGMRRIRVRHAVAGWMEIKDDWRIVKI